jgi:probable rRNA maturation factor
VAVDAAHLGALARAVLVDHGLRRGELSLSFVDEDTMADLNGRYLDGDGPTDVLAFPLDAPSAEATGTGTGEAFPAKAARPAPATGSAAGEMPVLLGDVAVCPAVADRNAAARSLSPDDELALLVVHGVLHVLGMDHAEPDEAAAMQVCERRLLERWHFLPRQPLP